MGFGTYDFNGSNGVTHWVVVSGKSVVDNMMLLWSITKQADFYTLINERGEVERLSDYEYEMIKAYY